MIDFAQVRSNTFDNAVSSDATSIWFGASPHVATMRPCLASTRRATLRTAPIGPYQLQAAIAAVHGQAARAEETDWREILVLYELLETLAPGPMVSLNRIVAAAMVHGPAAGLDLLNALDADGRLAGHRLDAVRAHLLELAGDPQAAIAHYGIAAGRTTSCPNGTTC